MLLSIHDGTSKARKYIAVNDADFVGPYAPKPKQPQERINAAGHAPKPIENWQASPVFTPAFTSPPKRKRTKPMPQYPKHRWSN